MEFRQAIRKLLEKDAAVSKKGGAGGKAAAGGSAPVDTKGIDALFDSWDDDKGGELDEPELRAIFRDRASFANVIVLFSMPEVVFWLFVMYAGATEGLHFFRGAAL